MNNSERRAKERDGDSRAVTIFTISDSKHY